MKIEKDTLANFFKRNKQKPFFKMAEIAKALGYSKQGECTSIINTAVKNGVFKKEVAKSILRFNGIDVVIGHVSVILNPSYDECK